MFNAKIIILALCMLITGALRHAAHSSDLCMCMPDVKCKLQRVMSRYAHDAADMVCALAGTVNTITTKYQARHPLLISDLCSLPSNT